MLAGDVQVSVGVAHKTRYDVGKASLAALFGSPLYRAEIVCCPAPSDARSGLVALPFTSIAAAPNATPSTENWTVPVGPVLPSIGAAVTEAMNVAESPKVAGFSLD